MTLKSIRDAAISIVGSDTELQTADYNTFINEADGFIINAILKQRRDFFPLTETISVISGDIDITPVNTFDTFTLIQVDFADGAGYQTLTKGNMEEVLGANSTDTRSLMKYHLWGDVIYVPNFNKAFTMRILGYVIPLVMSGDSDIPSYSRLLHPLLTTWAVSRAVETNTANENFLDGSRKRQEFFDELDMILPQIILKDSTNIKSLI